MEAKFHLPAPHPSTVARERLTGLLLAEPRPSAVAVVAPPGYGKTVLLADWAARETRAVAWLTLDTYDNDSSVFLTYLAAAIDRIEPIDPAVGAALTAHGSRALATTVPRLASELHRRGRPGVLVLDDLHNLVDRTCLDALGVLLDLLPPGFQVAMAARTTPDLPFGRLRARRQLLEIGRDQLAFDAEEAQALAARAGHPLGRDEARALADRTEGWAAAIYLAALAGGRDRSRTAEAAGVSGREGYIADYLDAELRPALDDQDVALLTRTSILDAVEPELAAVVAGMPDGPERLRRLVRMNLLISEVAGRAPAYRYHTLLRDYLRAELGRREPDAEPALHGRAAAWYATAGRPELAIEHAIASGDVDAAALLVEEATQRTYLQGNGDRLDRWLGIFDDAAFARRPCLAVGAAFFHALSGRPEAADHLADIVERSSFDGAPANGAASFESARAMLRASMVRHGPDAAVADAAFAVAAERPGSSWRTLACEILALGHIMRGDPAAADAELADAIDAAPSRGSYAFYALALRASLAMARREWDAAARYAREAHDRFGQMHVEAVAASVLVHAVSARVAIRHGDVVRGRTELVHAQLVRPLASHALPSTAVVAQLEVARAYLAIADPAGAADAVAEAERILHRRPDLGILADEVAELRERARGSGHALAGPSTLTPAELRVLPMLATHLRFKEIAARLHLSPHTVKTQVVSIYGKLGVSNRSEAVDRAIAIGLLEPFPGLGLTGRAAED
ncbi:MAG: LuxR C-terminal-related transcriptional regulator [Chloroflexi bacterium]|nr:LuxR C-terminal-related transcriptional regulator [Chloroflexota bacterium]